MQFYDLLLYVMEMEIKKNKKKILTFFKMWYTTVVRSFCSSQNLYSLVNLSRHQRFFSAKKTGYHFVHSLYKVIF